MKKITSSILAVALMGIFAIQNTFAQYNLDPEKEVKEVKDITEIQEIEAQIGSSVVVEEKTNTSNISNLQPRPRIFTLVNKAKLNQDSVTLGGVSKPSIDEELVSLDFGDTARGKR